MWKERLWRISLATSICVNVAAVTLVGYSRIAHPDVVHAQVEKAPPSRLVEIQELKPAAAADRTSENDGAKADSKGTDDENGSGNDPTSPGSIDSAGPEASAARRARLNPKPLSLRGSGQGRLARQSQPTQVEANLHSHASGNFKIEMTVPKPHVVPGVTGVIDLSHAHVNIQLHADASKVPAHYVPNKYIGTSHHRRRLASADGRRSLLPDLNQRAPHSSDGEPEGDSETELNGAHLSAKCVGHVGGDTVYPGHVKTILGPGITVTGTKYCSPGAGGMPGNGSGQQPSGSPTTADGASAGSGNEAPDDSLPYNAKLLKALGSDGSGGKGAGSDPHGKAGANGSGQGANAGGGHSSGAGQGASGEPGGDAGVAHDTIDASMDPGQAALDAKARALARGPVHGIDDQRFRGLNMGLQTAGGAYVMEPRELHLPTTHGDPTDRVHPTGADGSLKSLGSARSQHQQVKPAVFEPAPVSVGSHSERGTVPWGPDSRKKPRPHGLLGNYFIGRDFETYKCSRTDPNIDYTWTGEQVDPRLPMGQPFSVRWTGFVRPRYTETYTIYTTSDDGVRLYIDGKLLITNWTIHPATENVITYPMEAGKEYAVKLEYFEQTGLTREVMKLYWESPHQPKEYVPESCLFPSKEQ